MIRWNTRLEEMTEMYLKTDKSALMFMLLLPPPNLCPLLPDHNFFLPLSLLSISSSKEELARCPLLEAKRRDYENKYYSFFPLASSTISPPTLLVCVFPSYFSFSASRETSE